MAKHYNEPGAYSNTNQITEFSHQIFTGKQNRFASRSPSNKRRLPKITPTNIDVVIRSILACSIAFSIPFTLFVYMQTKEVGVLGLTTVLGVTVGLVYTYYFPGKKGK